MKNILLLQTGGTIAMHFGTGGKQTDSARWSNLLYKEIPELSTLANLQIENVFFEDSSDINRDHWKRLTDRIYSKLDDYDGFVILHGTDTMAYTASALSFAFRNLAKPVILTGSQVPMSNIRSDARRNLVNAVELATHPIPEVAICFNDHLYRGNRSTKMSIGDFDAFASPNFPPLADIGIHISISHSELISPLPGRKTRADPRFDDNILVLKMHPNLNPSLFLDIDLSGVKAVVVEAFGTGNVPIRGRYNFLPFIERCRDQNCQVIITSQAAYDAVDLDIYESGRALKNRGAISAGDMTMEATVTKAMHLIALGLADEDFKTQFMDPLSGERSV